MNQSNIPLVTFALFAYNQEEYVAEAVRSALAQTYMPLEIILSDDCSTDGTFDIMQSLAENYSGPHVIKLNRNSRNLGIGAHVNHSLSMARGAWIVMAAGDDVSNPYRVESLVGLTSENSRYKALFSGMEIIDDEGRQIETSLLPGSITHRDNLTRMIPSWCPGIHGATSAWHRDLFDFFGPLESDAVTEDRILAMRAALLGEIGYLSEALVRYRRHGNNVSGAPGAKTVDELRNSFRKDWSHGEVTARNYIKDIDTFTEKTGDENSTADSLRVARRLWNVARRCVRFADCSGSIEKIWLSISVVTFDFRLTLRMLAIGFAPKLYLRRLISIANSRL